MLNKILDLLNNNPWLNLFSLGLGVLGIGVSVLLFIVSKKEKCPVYDISSFNLIKGSVSKLEGVKVTFNDSEIENLTTSVLALWNSGRNTIDHRDIASADPIRLEVDPTQTILDVEVIFEKEKSNSFKASLVNQYSVLIDFDYFHKNEGIIIRVYHTGTSSDDVKVLGKIKGVGQFKCVRGDEFYLLSRFTKFVDKTYPELEKAGSIGLVIALIVILPVTVVFSLVGIAKYLLKPIPKEFRKLDNFGEYNDS